MICDSNCLTITSVASQYAIKLTILDYVCCCKNDINCDSYSSWVGLLSMKMIQMKIIFTLVVVAVLTAGI